MLRFSFFVEPWRKSVSSGFRRAKNIQQRTTTAAYRSIWVFFVIFCDFLLFRICHFHRYFLQILRVLHLRTPDSKAMVCIGTVYTALRRMHVATCSLNKKCFKKHDSAGNNEQNSNWPVGRYSGLLVDIFGSTEPWTHALSEGCWREKLNLNILGSKIEIYAQNSAFLRCLECANLST